LIQRKAAAAGRPKMPSYGELGGGRVMVDTSSRDRIRTITIPPAGLEGTLGLPTAAKGIVLFAHGSGSGRLSPRNNFVAQALRDSGLSTLLFDLLDLRDLGHLC
jgi:hypothetical protein